MEKQMKTSVDKIKSDFDEKMHNLKVQVNGEVQRMTEDINTLQSKLDNSKMDKTQTFNVSKTVTVSPIKDMAQVA